MTNTQHNMIIKHLETTKGITVREAMIEYSISSLTKRIHELRGMGYDIESIRKQHPVTGQRYTRYHLLSNGDI
jgi:biotin operon repressor